MAHLPLWKNSWDQAEQAWDQQAKKAAENHPLKTLKSFPKMVGITKETAKNLKWKSLKWMIQKDNLKQIRKGFLKHPFKYGWALLKSLCSSSSYKREGDFFLYGLSSVVEFEVLLKNVQSLLVLGFSYCHKPFECPSGRFTDQCIHENSNLICQQCFIGKAVKASQAEQTIPLFIPTVHYIGGKIFDLVDRYPHHSILFIITACEMTLKMFADWGNMINIQGIGVRLEGRICNTMKAFELSEQGIKPGLTVVLKESQKQILKLIRLRQESFQSESPL